MLTQCWKSLNCDIWLLSGLNSTLPNIFKVKNCSSSTKPIYWRKLPVTSASWQCDKPMIPSPFTSAIWGRKSGNISVPLWPSRPRQALQNCQAKTPLALSTSLPASQPQAFLPMLDPSQSLGSKLLLHSNLSAWVKFPCRAQQEFEVRGRDIRGYACASALLFISILRLRMRESPSSSLSTFLSLPVLVSLSLYLPVYSYPSPSSLCLSLLVCFSYSLRLSRRLLLFFLPLARESHNIMMQ